MKNKIKNSIIYYCQKQKKKERERERLSVLVWRTKKAAGRI